jgi:DNA-binding MarR family transcriptional regulator
VSEERPTSELPTRSGSERIRARALHMMGDDAAASWDSEQALAWEGMLELGRRLRRRAEEMLAQDHDLSVSMLGMMGRLRGADRRTLRQSALAEAMGLSVSRASRVIDLLEERGHVSRAQCPSDGRATNVTLTDQGIRTTESAQHDLFVMVSDAFADRLSADETATLARVFGRLLADGAA